MMFRQFGKIALQIIILAFSMLFPAIVSASAVQLHPQGRYCGEVLHNGMIVQSEVSLGMDDKGRLTGTMRFRDGKVITEGKVREITATTGTTRTIEWSDKYGYGFAIFKFDPAFTEFKGLWGPNIEKPSHVWNGKSCSDLTS